MSSEHSCPRVWIRAIGDYCEPVGAERPSLKSLVREALGVPVRRVGRFIQLALIGSGRCIGHDKPDPATAVYLSSARGDLDTTLEVVDALYREGQPPMPLTFINAVSNAGCYYVARELGLTGSANFTGNAGLALESALELARSDLTTGDVEQALVGSVDIASRDADKHRTRMGLSTAVTVGEGSHWLWLAAGSRPSGAIGELLAARSFGDRAAMVEWLRRLDWDIDRAVVSWGQFASAEDAERVAEALGGLRVQPPPHIPAYYDSQCGHILSVLLQQATGQAVIYINRELYGARFAAIALHASSA